MTVKKKMMFGALAGVSLAALAHANAQAQSQPVDCKGADPYEHYECLDTYLGTGFFERLARYYKLEWGHGAAPVDPNAPPTSREGWPATPMTSPPMPFTEWPYGGTTTIGVNRPASADSPLMVALGNSGFGSWMAANNLQIYGWVDPGFNVSSSSTKPGGNAPAAYLYTPNTAQLDQFVLYFERTPDTVQTDHIDWGFRLSGIYGENYRYTTAYGIASYQLTKRNNINGYDFPMVYAELYIPKIFEGLLIRAGRFISPPDIEAQLAPNNYMYTHSLTYTFDNYTNTGVIATLAVTKNLFAQLGVSSGTESPPWHMWDHVPNPYPNPLYPMKYFYKDPGSKPSVTGCLRYQTDSGDDNIYACGNGINSGTWGYNNLQWYGVTYYHRFDEHWHVSLESYNLHQDHVPNLNNATAQTIVGNGGTPFSPQYLPFNAPNQAFCDNPNVLSCRASAQSFVGYLNYSPDALNNISFRPEFYDDKQGQRTGTKTRYVEFGVGWQHWLSPQIELRPEVTYYRSLDAPAFNGNSNSGIAPNKSTQLLFAADAIIHF